MAPPTPSPRDPNGFVTNPPSMVVKVSHTARDDINGLLGIVMSYNTERERYLVHMTAAQSTMAFKKENLVTANTWDSYKAQWQQLRNDPRVKEKMFYYLQQCRNWVSPWKLQYVLAVFLLTLVLLMYLFGFTKTVMVLSYAILLLVIAGPDILAKKQPKIIAQNFPNRARLTLEQHLPLVRGKVTNRIAMGVLLFMGALVLQSLFFVHKNNNTTVPPSPLGQGQGQDIGQQDPVNNSNSANTLNAMSMATAAATATALQKEKMETFYNLGFQDAEQQKPHGSGLLPALEELETEAKVQAQAQAAHVLHHENSHTSDYLDFASVTAPSSDQKSQFGSITNAMSMFYLYRTVMELGKEQMTGLFSMAQLFANLHTIPIWRKGVLALSVYKVLRIFI
jgi:hypothetical protein